MTIKELLKSNNCNNIKVALDLLEIEYKFYSLGHKQYISINDDSDNIKKYLDIQEKYNIPMNYRYEYTHYYVSLLPNLSNYFILFNEPTSLVTFFRNDKC